MNIFDDRKTIIEHIIGSSEIHNSGELYCDKSDCYNCLYGSPNNSSDCLEKLGMKIIPSRQRLSALKQLYNREFVAQKIQDFLEILE